MVAEKILLDILKTEVGIGQSIVNVDLSDMLQVVQLAKDHTMMGVVAEAVCSGKVTVADNSAAELNDDLKLQKAQMAAGMIQADAMHRRKYKLFSDVTGEFERLMRASGLRYVVFKGMAVARHFPAPHVRTMGDVDFYVPSPDFRRAVEAIESAWKVEIEKKNIDKHYSFDYRDIHFEMHYQVETFGRGSHQRYFNRLVDACVAEDNHVLPPMADLIVVFKHWFNHLLVEGVGLRQTLDLAVLLRAYKDEIDAGELQRHLKAIGYWRAFKAMVAMEERYLGVTCAARYCVLGARDYLYADRLMAVVMESGNFGRRAYANRAPGLGKSIETAWWALGHCARFFWLAPTDIASLVPKRIGITMVAHRARG